jgi:hypothetical protein
MASKCFLSVRIVWVTGVRDGVWLKVQAVHEGPVIPDEAYWVVVPEPEPLPVVGDVLSVPLTQKGEDVE